MLYNLCACVFFLIIIVILNGILRTCKSLYLFYIIFVLKIKMSNINIPLCAN